MSIDEYMGGWRDGARPVLPGWDRHVTSPDGGIVANYRRGYAAGRAAYRAAEAAERARLERCPRCKGSRVIFVNTNAYYNDRPCPDCHGTGRRAP